MNIPLPCKNSFKKSHQRSSEGTYNTGLKSFTNENFDETLPQVDVVPVRSSDHNYKHNKSSKDISFFILTQMFALVIDHLKA